MLVRAKKPFLRGLALLLSFGVLFALIISPIFKDENGNSLTGLEYADNVFNQLSKGSSFFFPEVRKNNAAFMETSVDLTVDMRDPYRLQLAEKLLKDAGITDVSFARDSISFRGKLGPILEAATQDSELLYNNDGSAVSRKYDIKDPLLATSAWWHLLSPCIQALQREMKIPEAKAVDLVLRKAIEPGNNFFSIAPAKVSENIILICLLLAFYVIYSIWYGFGLYNIFEGLGLFVNEKAQK